MSDDATENTGDVTESTGDWYEALPDNLRDAPFFRAGKDGTRPSLDNVLESLSNAAKLKGNMAETHIRIPGPDAGDEDRQKAVQRAVESIPGLRIAKEGEDSLPPKDPDGYKAPEGVDVEALKPVREFAHKHGWGQEQFQEYAERLAGEQKAAIDNQKAWRESQKAAISEVLGDAKEEHLARTLASVADIAPEGFVEKMVDGSIDAGTYLMLDKLVHKMLDMGGEQSQFVQQARHASRELTPSEHMDKAMEIMGKLREMRPHDHGYNELNQKRMEHVARANRH